MAVLFSIDSRASKDFAVKLQKMKASAFPNAVRETLSKAALNVKQKTMPVTAKKAFTERQKNFFKANSKVDFAKGKDIKTMQSTVGFISEKLKGGNNYAIKDLEQQENGGMISGRSLMPLDSARKGKNRNNLVFSKFRLENIKRVYRVRIRAGVNKRQAWMKTVIAAKRLQPNNAYVIGNENSKGNRTLSRIDSVTKIGKKTIIKRTPLYSYVKDKKIDPNGTHFMMKASLETQSNMQNIFIAEAEKQIANIARRK